MSLPISIFLYIYLFALFVFLLGSIFVLYHIIRFGFEKKLVHFSSAIFISVSIIILLISSYYITQINWSTLIDFTFTVF